MAGAGEQRAALRSGAEGVIRRDKRGGGERDGGREEGGMKKMVDVCRPVEQVTDTGGGVHGSTLT
jgi:hypothetical protein